MWPQAGRWRRTSASAFVSGQSLDEGVADAFAPQDQRSP